MSRKLLRRKLILLSILPALMLVAIGVKLVTMVAYGHAARSDYLEYDSRGLADDVQVLKAMNVIDSYKAHFAEGDRYALEGRLTDAEAEFKTSLSLVDPAESCPVRINLEVVLETQGDLKSADNRRDEAKSLWQEALKTVQEAPAGCFDTVTEPDEEQRLHRNETEQRLLDKLKDPESEGGGGGGAGAGAGGQGEGQGEQGQMPAQGAEGGAQTEGPAGEGEAPAQGSPGEPAPDTVGADRIATDSGGSVHELRPGDGGPDDVLKRLLENSGASGVDRE